MEGKGNPIFLYSQIFVMRPPVKIFYSVKKSCFSWPVRQK